MINFKKYLIEGLSKILFHYTHIGVFDQILKTNKFKLASDIAKDAESNISQNGKYFYLSTTRSKIGAYHVDKFSIGDCVIVLDGDKLAQKYKGKAIDYWGNYMRTPTNFEAEDRVYSDKQFIDNAMSYMKEIHMIISKKYLEKLYGLDKINKTPQIQNEVPDDYYIKKFRTVLLLLKKNNIPYYLYDNQNAWTTQNKNKAIELDMNILKYKDKPNNTDYFNNDKIRGKYYLKPWLELYYTPIDKKEKLSKEALKILDYLEPIDSYRGKDKLNTFSSDMHNNYNNEIMSSFVDIFKKENLKNYKDYYNFLVKKWYFKDKMKIY